MTTSNDLESVISDAIEDQHGRRYFRFGTDERHVWLPFATVAVLDHKTIERLSRFGVRVATNKTKEALKLAVEARADYRSVLIADAPGWLDNVYVLRDGRVCGSSTANLPIIVFETDERFAATSTVLDWQSAVGPLVRNQPLLLFGLALSFVGPLMRFAPPDLHNLFVEIVGEPNVGKSTLAKLMSSVWGGGDGRLGVCQCWDFSPANCDPIRSEFRDGLLVLDEAAKAGDSDQERAKKIGSTVRAVSDSSTRRVFNADTIPQIGQAVLSTSNMPMRQLVGSVTDTEKAILSRVLTVFCDRAEGVLDTVPTGFDAAEKAIRALDLAVTINYGSAGEAFLKRLLRYSDDGIKHAIQKGMAQAMSRGLCGEGLGPRPSKTLAMIFAAGLIAKQLGIVPGEWGRMDEALRAAVETSAAKNAGMRRPPLDRIKDYVHSHQDGLIEIDDISLPLAGESFDTIPGIWLVKNQRLVVPTKFFRESLSDADEVLKEIDAIGRLDHDEGKLSKKAPRKITSGRRAYFFDLSPAI